MRVKNYYKTLELPPSATPQDVKKAYRRLALQYHPDKNPHQEAAASFREVQEAYHVLSNPERRSAFDQRRWYRQHTARATHEEVLTPALIHKKAVKLSRYIRTLDASFLNLRSLYRYIFHQLLGDPAIRVLQEANDRHTNQQIITELLDVSRKLPYERAKHICGRLQLIAGADAPTLTMLEAFMQQQKVSGYWEKYQPLAVIIITALVCLLIYMVSR